MGNGNDEKYFYVLCRTKIQKAICLHFQNTLQYNIGYSDPPLAYSTLLNFSILLTYYDPFLPTWDPRVQSKCH